MIVSKQEIKLLVEKYKKEGLKDKEIFNRIRDIFEMQDYIKFKKKYLR